jgi:membrane protein
MALKKTFFWLVGRSFAAAGPAMLKHEAPRDAASISYFSLIALFPAILVMISLVDDFLGWINLHGTVIESIIDLFPGSRIFLRSNLNEITQPSLAVFLSCALVFIWSSSWIFSFAESAINRAWDAEHQKTFWESRLRSIAFMALGGTSLLVSAWITAFVSNARERVGDRIPASVEDSQLFSWLWSFLLLGTGLCIAILMFTFIFEWIPHRRVYWREAFSGSVVFVLMWEIGSIIFVRLMPIFDYQRIYGKMGAMIALLVWVYTSSLILLFGANFSAQMHRIRISDSLPGSAVIFGKRSGSFSSGSQPPDL